MNQSNTGSSDEYDQTTPRLFRLRDLHPTKSTAPSPTASSVPDQPQQAGQPYLAEETARGHSLGFKEPPASKSLPADHGDTNGNFEDLADESAEQIKTRERIERHLDVSPEGRSWMESALAHRKVLVLLVLAMSAAFWTSREDKDHDKTTSDPEFAQATGTLEFDPTQFDAGTLVDDGQDFFPTENVNDASSRSLIVNAEAPAANAPTTGSTFNQNLSSFNRQTGPIASQTAELASNSLVPKPTNNTANSAASTRSQGAPATENAALGTVASAPLAPSAERTMSQISSNGLSVETVSSRTPRDPVFNAPSAIRTPPSADLNNAAPIQKETELTLQNSNTPNGVNDWLKYIPTQP